MLPAATEEHPARNSAAEAALPNLTEYKRRQLAALEQPSITQGGCPMHPGTSTELGVAGHAAPTDTQLRQTPFCCSLLLARPEDAFIQAKHHFLNKLLRGAQLQLACPRADLERRPLALCCVRAVRETAAPTSARVCVTFGAVIHRAQ